MNIYYFGDYKTDMDATIKFSRLSDQLTEDEGFKNKPYLDTKGKLTIGVGRNLDDNGLSDREIRILLMNDIDRTIVELESTIPYFITFNDVRQEVLTNLCFALGLPKFMGFKRMLAALEKRDFETAAMEILDSKWAREVGERANRLAKQMKTGVY
jgi:lysozyme